MRVIINTEYSSEQSFTDKETGEPVNFKVVAIQKDGATPEFISRKALLALVDQIFPSTSRYGAVGVDKI